VGETVNGSDAEGRRSTRIYLVRHGQVEGFEKKRYNGQADVRLTPLGFQQFEALGDKLRDKPVAAVYSSDLSRCLEGARLLASPHGLQPVALPALRELHIGHWQGRTWEEIRRSHPAEWQGRLADIVNFRVRGGENLLDVLNRVRPVVRKLLDRHPGREIIVVGHGGVNRILLLDLLGAPLSSMFRLEQDFGCLNVIDYSPGGNGTIRLLNG
jgi:alpha-ribazole phosphatase